MARHETPGLTRQLAARQYYYYYYGFPIPSWFIPETFFGFLLKLKHIQDIQDETC